MVSSLWLLSLMTPFLIRRLTPLRSTMIVLHPDGYNRWLPSYIGLPLAIKWATITHKYLTHNEPQSKQVQSVVFYISIQPHSPSSETLFRLSAAIFQPSFEETMYPVRSQFNPTDGRQYVFSAQSRVVQPLALYQPMRVGRRMRQEPSAASEQFFADRWPGGPGEVFLMTRRSDGAGRLSSRPV